MSAKKPASSLSPGSIPPPIESDFGRLDAPGVRFGENCAGAGDPGQFLAAAWERYGVDGDGVKGRYDAGDAIPAPANLLHQHGAPGDYGRAIFAYNHAGSYVEEVLSRAARGAARPDATAAHAVPVAHIGPTAACTDDAARGPVNLASAVRLTSPAAYRQLPAWAMAGGRPLEPVDARIHDDVLWALRRYGLRVSAAREPRHRTHGDGTAVDLVPAVGATQADWDASAGRLASRLGWTASCGASGARPACPLRPAIQWIGYDGYRDRAPPDLHRHMPDAHPRLVGLRLLWLECPRHAVRLGRGLPRASRGRRHLSAPAHAWPAGRRPTAARWPGPSDVRM